MRTQNLNAKGFLFAVEQQFDLADTLSFAQSSIVIVELFAPHRVVDTGRFGAFFIHTDAGQFRVCVGTPGHMGVIGFFGQMKNGITQNHSTLIAGHMRELIATENITGRIDMFVAGFQVVVYFNALAVERHTDFFKPEPGDIGGPAHSHQDGFGFKA